MIDGIFGGPDGVCRLVIAGPVGSLNYWDLVGYDDLGHSRQDGGMA